jgi:4-hydroxybenzoyl-CoA thioesterase
MEVWSERLVVAWAECDAAGKVFYPNYYIWFDRSTEKLFKANGLSFADLQRKFAIIGMPLLQTHADYRNACLHGAELTIESRVDEWSGRAFTVGHTVTHADGRPALSGYEKRVFVAAAPERPAGIRAIAPPEEIVTVLGGRRVPPTPRPVA